MILAMTKPPEKPARESEFWRFSVAFYGLPDVSAACLVLQDEAQVDVNILLYLLFLAWSKREVKPEHVAELDAAVGIWREEVVKRLRALRRCHPARDERKFPQHGEACRARIRAPRAAEA